MTIAILSTSKLPRFLGDDHPDEESLFAEDDILVRAFASRGVAAERVPWRRRDAQWRRYDLVLVRSTWDYIDDLPAFLAVLDEIEAAGCRLVNPAATIRWNCDKRYLAELQAAGVPIVPTAVLEPGKSQGHVIDSLGPATAGYVSKPLVGVGGFGVRRLADRQALFDGLARNPVGQARILQPFLPSIAEEGEWSFVFGCGRFLYAALKTPKAGDFRVQVMYGARTEGRVPAAADLDVAQACLKALPVEAHFARMDLARMPDGRLALMEAELIEPQLYFFDLPEAAGLVADAAMRLRKPG